MQFFILVLLICLFIFLYCVFVLANDDFIFLRRDITMDKIFNIIFLGSFISLFMSRLFYGFFYNNIVFLNPLKFLLIPYFPGLSLLGGVVGIIIFFIFLKNREEKQFPLERIGDFFSIAFLISLPIGFVGYYIFSEKADIIKLSVQALIYFVLFIIFLKFFLPKLLSGKFKEGSVTFLFLICFSIINLIFNIFLKVNILQYFKNFENILLIVILLLSSGMLVREENLLSKIRQLKKGK
jgi:prolipoprotein diacylglyceryltransferase